ncbi:unnamed protein product [Tuber aestivum]|uniref:Uncharacterized protein n=1 Tax=Tuber aestivum TaxID=59557 RepID=A0A292PMZ2_9PEZI|nr:unnamed protein product [Tuber aestivum]
MEDWGSPWADDEKLSDNDDGPKEKFPPRAKGVEEEGNHLEREGEAVVTPVAEEKRDVGETGLAVDWDSGFADSSAWANATPREQVRDGNDFGWGALGLGDLPGVGAKGGGGSGEEGEVRIEDDWRGSDEDGDVKAANPHPIATDEVNAWGAGSDWGDPKTPEPRIGRTKSAPGLSLGEVGDNTPDGGSDTEVKSLPTPDVERHDQLIDAANLLSSPKKQWVSDRVAQNVKGGSKDHLQPVLEAVSETQEDPRDAGPPPSEPHSATASVCEASSSRGGFTNVNAGDQDDDDDDFGDFAAEGGEFEELQAPISEPTLPAVITAPPPDSFEIDVSFVSKLYPIPTSRPDPPPIEEIISTTESRKTWYRLSTSGTIRRNRSDDDDYVRVMWVGSKVQESVNKIVEKWMTEDRNSGGSGLMGGGKRVSAMFGWGDGSSRVSDQKPISLERTAPQLSSGGHSRKASGSGLASLPTQCLLSKPAGIGIPSSSEPVDGGSVSSPHVASFGWSSRQSQSCPNSVKGEEKTPSTPLRTNLHSSTRHSLPSQLAPENMSRVPRSPTTDKSAGPSMMVTSTTISPIQSPTAGTKNGPVAPAPEFLPAAGNSITTHPLPTGLPADTQAANLASTSGFDDWGALENAPANAPPASPNIQSRNYDEWGAFENPAPKEPAPVIGSESPPVVTSLKSIAPVPIPSVQSPSESNKKLNSAQTALGAANTTIDRGDLGSLSFRPPKSQTPSNVSSSRAPKNENIDSPAWPELKGQKASRPGPVEDSREGSNLSIPPTSKKSVSGDGSFISTPINGSASDSIKKDPIIYNAQTQQDSDEGDDWGEMVQCPVTPLGVFGPTEGLMVPAPASSQDIASLIASAPPAPSIPQRIPALDSAPVPPSVPAQAIQPTSAPSAALWPGSFGQKSGSNIGDPWDLSFFEGHSTPNSGFPIPKDIPQPDSQDLWDTPTVVQGKAPESANDKAIREIVEGLPDLSYMFG